MLEKFATFLQDLPQRKLKAGEVIFGEGERLLTRYIVVKGVVTVGRHDSAGVARHLLGALAGEVIPFGARVKMPDRVDSYYIAHTDVVLAEFNDEVFERMIRDPQLIKAAFLLCDERMSHAVLRIATLVQARAEDKIMYMFRYMVERLGESTDDMDVKQANVRLSQTDIGNSLGLSRETVAKSLQTLANDKIIKHVGRGNYQVNTRLLDYALESKRPKDKATYAKHMFSVLLATALLGLFVELVFT